jgi:hypothetical protein
LKLEDYRETYYTFSAKASDVTRQLCFAGIALVWVFKQEKGGPLAVPAELLWPALLFAAALAFDLAQSILGTLIWGTFARYHECAGMADDAELDAPRYVTWPTLVCFWGKLLLLMAGYVLVVQYVYALLPKR